jgi:ATP-binding cassette subfamily C (CFTR/MRP) protein 1
MFLAILGLLELDHGSILVDGVDLSKVPQSIIQQRCFITIPQSPFLCPEGSLAFNLDTTGCCTPDDIIFVLKVTGLWPVFCNALTITSDDENTTASPDALLSARLSSLPVLTPGQLQLFSMARAILQLDPRGSTSSAHIGRRPIILLDEPTASLDALSEHTLYRLLDTHFVSSGSTVLIISHKVEAARKFNMGSNHLVVKLELGEMVKNDIVDQA